MAEKKKNCNKALHELYTFLDGELTDLRRAQIRKHLDDCPPCFEAYDFEAELRQVIAQKCRDSVPDKLRQRVADALNDEKLGCGPHDPPIGDLSASLAEETQAEDLA